uniref:Uncharacterized protein n=1 Tax=Arundo donax TaxID=35708 RepID=A0A0A9D687_ARUDO
MYSYTHVHHLSQNMYSYTRMQSIHLYRRQRSGNQRQRSLEFSGVAQIHWTADTSGSVILSADDLIPHPSYADTRVQNFLPSQTPFSIPTPVSDSECYLPCLRKICRIGHPHPSQTPTPAPVSV